jgi:hypothetical protein
MAAIFSPSARRRKLETDLPLDLGADDPLAAALLGAVVGDAGALDEPEVGDGDDAALVRHHVLHPELAGGGDDLGAAG